MKPKLLLGNSKIGCSRFNLWGSLHYLGRSFVPGCYKMRKTHPSQLQYTVKNTQYLKLKFNHINKVSKIIFLPKFISFQFFCWMSNSVFRVLLFISVIITSLSICISHTYVENVTTPIISSIENMATSNLQLERHFIAADIEINLRHAENWHFFYI